MYIYIYLLMNIYIDDVDLSFHINPLLLQIFTVTLSAVYGTVVMSYVLVPLKWSNQRPFAIRIPTLRQTKMPCPYGDPSATVVSWIVSGFVSFCFHMADEFQCCAGYMQLAYLRPKPRFRTSTIIIILVSCPLRGEIVILYVFFTFSKVP